MLIASVPLHTLQRWRIITAPSMVAAVRNESCVKGALLSEVLDSAQKQPELVHSVQRELEFAVSCKVQTTEG